MEKKVFKTPTLQLRASKSSTNLNSTCLISKKSKVAGGPSKTKSSLTLNSTIGLSGTLSHDVTLTASQDTISTRKQSISYEIDLAYNEYLLTLMKKQNVSKIIEKHMEIQNGQIEYQTQRILIKKEQERDLNQEIEQINEKSELIELLDSLLLIVNKLEATYNHQEISSDLEKLSGVLVKECDKIEVQNVNKIVTQANYDKLMIDLKTLLVKTEILINSGRNFEKMNEMANKIRTYLTIRNEIQEKQERLFSAYEDSVYNMLKELSDIFAMQYVPSKD